MDIFNINIHQITRQYLEYIKAMRRLDLEVAGEFVSMAATLLHIKSKMLLPNYNEEGEEVETDPRKELVQKLLEYKKFQELSGDLYKRSLLGRDVFARGERTDVESLEEGELILEEKPLFALIAAYRTAVKNMKKTVHRVLGELQSIASRILEMKDLLVVGKRLVFGDLITDKANPGNQVLVTFLSLLELAKMGFISIFQSESFSDIHIESKRQIDRDIVSQVENYESVNAEEKAEKLMVEAQLSLDESVIESEDVAEGAVVQESPADAASDADIEAEERRLFADEAGVAVEVGVVNEAAVGVVDAFEAPAARSVDSDTEMQVTSAPDVGPAAMEAIIFQEALIDAQSEDSIVDPMAAQADAIAPAAPAHSIDTAAERNVLKAVSSALAAFESLSQEEEPPKAPDDRLPEVES